MTNEKPTALPPLPAEFLPQVIANPIIPKLYMQSFANFASAVDVTVVVLNCSVPTGVVTMSYEAAKGLIERLGEAVAKLEHTMGRQILSTDEAQAKLVGDQIG